MSRAAALIEEMRVVASVAPAPCYCGQRRERRGEPCRKVHYGDGHYDYQCGLL